jgi:hypothetical protein
LTEELLATARFYGSQNLGWARWRDDSDFVTGKQINLFRFVMREEVVEHLFAFRAENGKARLEFVPHLFVLLGGTRQTSDSTGALNGVKGSEVAKLHGEAVRGAPHLCSGFDDDGIASVKFSEREFAIQIERDEKVFARPFYCGSFRHAARLEELCGEMK